MDGQPGLIALRSIAPQYRSIKNNKLYIMREKDQ
jgi:hypothetical protein